MGLMIIDKIKEITGFFLMKITVILGFHIKKWNAKNINIFTLVRVLAAFVFCGTELN